MTDRKLYDLFDAAAPSELQRERMLRNLLHERNERTHMKPASTTATRRPPYLLRVCAACLALCLVCAACFQLFGASPLTLQVYAFGSGQELTSGDSWLQGGHLNDDGSGDGVLFYLGGEGVASIRFTTENQYLTFKDWSDQQEQVWRSQDFTVPYGPDAPADQMVYYWDPFDAGELLRNENVTVAGLPDRLRHDAITMTATFDDGRTLTQTLNIEVLDNGDVTLTVA